MDLGVKNGIVAANDANYANGASTDF